MIEFHMDWDNGNTTSFYGKRVVGPDFENRIFVLFSHSLQRKDYVEYLKYHVAEYASSTVWGSGDTKAEALSAARARVRELKQSGRFLECIKEGCARKRPFREARKARLLDIQNYLESFRNPTPTLKGMRRTVWAKSNGKCHYCEVTLTEGGSWHLEHMQPKSRGGSNDLENLVASCQKCNLEKKTMTAAEYIQYRQVKHQVTA